MASQHQQGAFRIATFRDFVPQKVRFVLLLIFAASFQISGGVYLASVSQMVGSMVLLEEDIRMAGYASFVGLVMTFPLVFRIKFRFKSRSIIMCVAAGIALCNLITMYTTSIPLLMAACFVTGSLRLIGTFECMSTLQGKLAPNHDQTLFFCVLFAIILSSIQFSGLATVYLDYYFSWQYMHVAVTGLMVIVAMCAFFLMKDIRLMKKLPLYGIDWMGAILWSVFLLSAIFTLQYGKYFDWFDSAAIRAGTVICTLAFVLATGRMLTARRPYYNPEILRYKSLKPGLALLFAMVLLLSTPTTIQGALTGAILHYDSLNTISLNWLVLAGVVVGVVLSWQAMAVRRVRYKWVIFAGFVCLVGYQAIMYFILDPRMTIQMLYLPSFLRGVGYALLYISLTLYPTQNIPFKYFLQPIGVLGFVRTGLGTAIGASLLGNWMTYLVKKNGMLLGGNLDAVNPLAVSISPGQLYGEVSRQAMLVSMKEILGWFTIGGVALLVLILAMPYIQPLARKLPTMRYYRRLIKEEVEPLQQME